MVQLTQTARAVGVSGTVRGAAPQAIAVKKTLVHRIHFHGATRKPAVCSGGPAGSVARTESCCTGGAVRPHLHMRRTNGRAGSLQHRIRVYIRRYLHQPACRPRLSAHRTSKNKICTTHIKMCTRIQNSRLITGLGRYLILVCQKSLQIISGAYTTRLLIVKWTLALKVIVTVTVTLWDCLNTDLAGAPEA